MMTTLSRILSCGAGVLMLASCSLFPAKNASLFRGIRLPFEEDVRFKTDGDIVGGLQAREGKAYCVTRKGSVYAFDGNAAKLLWVVPGTRPAASALAAGPGRLAYADADEAVHCLTLDGRELWKSVIPAKRVNGVVLASASVLAVADDDVIIALDASGGAETWRFKAAAAIQTPLAIWNSQIVFATADGKILMLDPRGRMRSAAETGSAIGGPLWIEKNRLFHGQAGGLIRCLDPANFKPLWKVKTGGLPSTAPAADEKRIYVVTANNVLYAFHKRNGNLDWWKILPAKTPFSPAAGEQQIFLTSSETSHLTVLDKSTGAFAGGYDLGAEIRSAPVLIGGYILIFVYQHDTDEGALVFLKGAPEPPKKQ